MTAKGFVRLIVAVVFVIVLGASLSVSAITSSDVSYFTFSAPIRLPGVVLPAGTYVFELIEPASRNVVRVSNRNRSQTYLIAITRPIDRPSPGNLDSRVVFGEHVEGTARPISVWYPQGRQTGREFLY